MSQITKKISDGFSWIFQGGIFDQDASASQKFAQGFGLTAMGIIITKNITAEYRYHKQNRVFKQHNLISIIHDSKNILDLDDSSVWDLFVLRNTNPYRDSYYISIPTQVKFEKQYTKTNKKEDIRLIINTTGGSLASSEIICNFIFNHTTSNIIAYIPRYAHSGGCMIALACSKIIMNRNAVLSPCDAQMGTGKGWSSYSTAAIQETAAYKKDKSEKICEEWLAANHDAKLCIERQKKFVDKLVQHGRYTKEAADKIYDEFFSGKYNHDHTFSAQEAKDMGLNITIVDEMPEYIKDQVGQ